jgi:hypothetical protein
VEGPLPTNFVDLTDLIQFSSSGSRYTQPPPLLNSIAWLTAVIIQQISTNAFDWGSLGAMVNVETLRFSQNTQQVTTAPAYLVNMVKLKTFHVGGSYTTARPGALDTFITNLYNLLTPVITSGDPFRNVTFFCDNVSGNDNSSVPSGIFQQPTGYVQGGSNGSPASSLERLWIFTNQYGWICHYQT